MLAGVPPSVYFTRFSRCKVIAFSTSLPIVGSRDMDRYDFTLVRSRRLGFLMTISLATLRSGGTPVYINSLIILPRPSGSNLNQIFSSCHSILSSPGAEVLFVLFRSGFNIFGHIVNAVPRLESVLPPDFCSSCVLSDCSYINPVSMEMIYLQLPPFSFQLYDIAHLMMKRELEA
jgi:hypothetical protein